MNITAIKKNSYTCHKEKKNWKIVTIQNTLSLFYRRLIYWKLKFVKINKKNSAARTENFFFFSEKSYMRRCVFKARIPRKSFDGIFAYRRLNRAKTSNRILFLEPAIVRDRVKKSFHLKNYFHSARNFVTGLRRDGRRRRSDWFIRTAERAAE